MRATGHGRDPSLSVDGSNGLWCCRSYVHGRRSRHTYQSPYRRRCVELMRSAFGRAVWGLRRGIEQTFGVLTSFGGGLSPLSSWVRHLKRVRLWVSAKLVIRGADPGPRRRTYGTDEISWPAPGTRHAKSHESPRRSVPDRGLTPRLRPTAPFRGRAGLPEQTLRFRRASWELSQTLMAIDRARSFRASTQPRGGRRTFECPQSRAPASIVPPASSPRASHRGISRESPHRPRPTTASRPNLTIMRPPRHDDAASAPTFRKNPIQRG